MYRRFVSRTKKSTRNRREVFASQQGRKPSRLPPVAARLTPVSRDDFARTVGRRCSRSVSSKHFNQQGGAGRLAAVAAPHSVGARTSAAPTIARSETYRDAQRRKIDQMVRSTSE